MLEKSRCEYRTQKLMIPLMPLFINLSSNRISFKCFKITRTVMLVMLIMRKKHSTSIAKMPE